MQTVAELVKQCLGVVEAQQGRFPSAHIPPGMPPGETVVVGDDWRYGLVQVFLIAVAARPGARSLAGPGEIVVQENAYMTAGFVANLPDPDIGMIDRESGALGESQAEQPARGVECRPHHVVEHEIRLDVGLVEVASGFPDLLRVVPPVPGLDRLVETFLAGYRLERRA